MAHLTDLDALQALAQRVNTPLKALQGQVDSLEIPAKTSELENDAGFQTETEVAAAVAAADHLKRKIVESVEAISLTADDASQYIYMVPKADAVDGDEYDEYMVLDGTLEQVGSWAVDLSGKVDKIDGKGLSTNDFTDEDKTKLAGLAMATTAEVDAMLDSVFGPAASGGDGE